MNASGERLEALVRLTQDDLRHPIGVYDNSSRQSKDMQKAEPLRPLHGNAEGSRSSLVAPQALRLSPPGSPTGPSGRATPAQLEALDLIEALKKAYSPEVTGEASGGSGAAGGAGGSGKKAEASTQELREVMLALEQTVATLARANEGSRTFPTHAFADPPCRLSPA